MIPKNKADIPAEWFYAPSSWRLTKDGLRAMCAAYPGTGKQWPLHNIMDLYHLSLFSVVLYFPFYIANGKELVLFDENEYLSLALHGSAEAWLDSKVVG